VFSNILKVTCPATGTVFVNVTEGVRVTVGAAGVYPLKLNDKPVPEQKLPDGVGVGVTPKLVILKSTSSQGILGVGVGIGSQSQSK
jgi:hypothetical protein